VKELPPELLPLEDELLVVVLLLADEVLIVVVFSGAGVDETGLVTVGVAEIEIEVLVFGLQRLPEEERLVRFATSMP